jgi:hypothetical protein
LLSALPERHFKLVEAESVAQAKSVYSPDEVSLVVVDRLHGREDITDAVKDAEVAFPESGIVVVSDQPRFREFLTAHLAGADLYVAPNAVSRVIDEWLPYWVRKHESDYNVLVDDIVESVLVSGWRREREPDQVALASNLDEIVARAIGRLGPELYFTASNSDAAHSLTAAISMAASSLGFHSASVGYATSELQRRMMTRYHGNLANSITSLSDRSALSRVRSAIEQPSVGAAVDDDPRLFWNSRFPGNEAVLQAPPGKLPRVLEGQIYEFETALESTASSGVSTPVIDSKGLIGSDVAFELMGTGVVFASQESPELFVRALKSQTFSCGPTGTAPFRVRCRFDVSGQAVIELELQVENSRFLNQRIELSVVGEWHEAGDSSAPTQTEPASRDPIDVTDVRRPRHVGLRVEIAGADPQIHVGASATGQVGFDIRPIKAIGTLDDMITEVASARPNLVALASRYPRSSAPSLPWSLEQYGDEVLLEFAKIGWDLHKALFGSPYGSKSSAPLARSISMVGRSPEGDTTAQIDDRVGVPIPWGLLYDAQAYGAALKERGTPDFERYRKRPKVPTDVDQSCFWGYRFSIYRTLVDRDAPIWELGDFDGSAYVTAVLNPTFDDALIGGQKNALTGQEGDQMSLTYEALISDRNALVSWVEAGDDSKCDLLYFFCHANMPTQYGEGGWQDAVSTKWMAELALGEKDDASAIVTLKDLSDLWPEVRKRRPLVFVNACGSAQADPLYGNPFVEHFVRDWGSRALVGTDWTVPTDFADVFSRSVVARLRSGEALIDALRSSSREAFAAGNLYPLIYALYGEPELCFARLKADA